MCEFCHKHGEGKKWYLQAKNYSEELLSDLERRKFILEFMAEPEKRAQSVSKLKKVDALPAFVQATVKPQITRRQQETHFGQVVPIEECEKIFEFVTSVVRLACLCRQSKHGSEKRYCYGISVAPNGGKLAEIIKKVYANYLNGPNAVGLEVLSKEEALKNFREYEKEGMCHTVWTFKTPFIGGICNCDRADCLAMRASVNYSTPIMFRAEYIAEIEPEECNGCRKCMRVCQFGAIGYSAADKKAEISQKQCWGCGICRSACDKDAIKLKERSAVPAMANVW